MLIVIDVVESLLKPDFVLLCSETHDQQLPQEAATTNALAATIANGQAARNTRRLTSPVWAHFEIRKFDGLDMVECNYYGKKLSGKGKN